jgi:hypothetical protein
MPVDSPGSGDGREAALQTLGAEIDGSWSSSRVAVVGLREIEKMGEK